MADRDTLRTKGDGGDGALDAVDSDQSALRTRTRRTGLPGALRQGQAAQPRTPGEPLGPSGLPALHRPSRRQHEAAAPERHPIPRPHPLARPPRGQHTVRHFGLYASRLHRQRHRCAHLLEPRATPMPPRPATLGCDYRMPTVQPLCARCHAPLQRVLSVLPTHRIGEFSKGTGESTTAGSTGRSTIHAKRASALVFDASRHRRPSSSSGVTVN